ncbi:helix-turn-helix domain-containing protein [Taklimakanibacter deserti]|uniref:helix-turn-helix domain-containing protein n=1 Tax=Taklimakanibacter deserti TaxID=2267839 RepID=UPI000E65AB8E
MEFPNRIRELRKSRIVDGKKMTLEQLSERTGLSTPYLSRLERGEERNLNLKTLGRISAALGAKPADILVQDDHIPSEQIAAEMTEPTREEGGDLLDYAGIVEAGAFREVDELDQRQPHKIPFLRSPKYPMARHMAFKVAGDSMDLEKMLDGMWAEVVDAEQFFEYYGPLKDGDIVVVERTKDQGALRERTVKQLRVYADRWELQPRSSNPRHKPIVVLPGMDHLQDKSVAVIGLVLTWGMLSTDRRP